MIPLRRWFCNIGLLLVPFLFAAGGLVAAPEWRVLETPRFRVVSQLSEKETRAWVNEFNQFIGSLSSALTLNERFLPQLSVVLFARESDFKPYLPPQPNGKPWAVAGFFARRDAWATIGLAERLQDVETRRTIFHEGVHWIMSAYPRFLPLCINEGLAEVYSTFEVKKDRACWGNPVMTHVAFLNRSGEPFIPIDQLLITTNSNPIFNEEARVGVFYAESWALVHYLMFGNRRGAKSALDDFLKAYADSGLTADQAFRKSFGLTYGGMELQLKAYLRTGQYNLGSSPVPQTDVAPGQFVAASADVVEIALARLALGSKHFDLAHRHVAAAIQIAPGNPAAFDTLACIESEELGNNAPLATIEKAIQLGSKDAWTHILYAFAKGRAAVALGGVPPAEARKIADLLERAIDLRPNLLTAYKNLGIVLLEVEKVTRQDVASLRQGLAVFPESGVLLSTFAQLAWKLGSKDEARKMLANVLAHPKRLEPAELANAREAETRWLFLETMENVQRLMAVGKAFEALGQIDKLLAKQLPPTVRGGLTVQRRIIASYARFEEAKEVAKTGRKKDAREICNEILNTANSPQEVKRMAEQLLRLLDAPVERSLPKPQA